MKIAAIGVEAREKLAKGVDFVADGMKLTMGPYGMNAALEKGNRITNDGITIAKELMGAIEDDLERRGATLFVDAISKANEEAGDGSTTAGVLTQAVYKQARKNLAKEGVFTGKKTPIQVIRQIETERKEITDKLIEMAVPVKDSKQLIEVAKVSVEDEDLGELIGTAQWDVGPEGVLMAEEVNSSTSSVEYVKGVRIDNGFGTAVMINNQERQSLEVDEARVILTNLTIRDLNPLKGVIDQLVQMGNRNVILIGRAFTPEAIQICLQNIQKGGLNIYPINAPYVDQAAVMYDMAAVLGGRFINEEEDELGSIQVSDVGYAKKVVAKRWTAVFTGKDSNESESRISARIESLKKKLDGELSDFERRLVEGRIAQLKNGFAVVRVGANSETERKYKKDKVDDAVNAVRAALQEGVVPGAGVALKTIAESLPEDYLLKQAITAPYDQIMANAGEVFEVPEWVRDPVKVVRIALEKACSVASTLATSQIVVANKTERPGCAQSRSSTEGVA